MPVGANTVSAMALWDAIRGLGRSLDPERLVCSFCGASRMAVGALLAGPNGIHICDACVRLCVDVIDEQDRATSNDPLRRILSALLRDLASLPRPFSLADTRRIVDAALALADGDRDACLEIAATAHRVGDHASAVMAMRRIAKRTADDAQMEADYQLWTGAHEEAAALIEAIDTKALSDSGRALHPLFRLMVRLVNERTTAEEARAANATIDEALFAFSPAPDAATLEAVESLAVRARALAARRRGELALAESLLAVHLERRDAHVQCWALLHDVLQERGKDVEARSARERVLRHAHPESHLAKRMRALEHGPFR